MTPTEPPTTAAVTARAFTLTAALTEPTAASPARTIATLAVASSSSAPTAAVFLALQYARRQALFPVPIHFHLPVTNKHLCLWYDHQIVPVYVVSYDFGP